MSLMLALVQELLKIFVGRPKSPPPLGWNRVSARSKFWGVVRVGGQGWGDNSIQFINFGRVRDKRFKEWRQKMGGGGWRGG